jgi:hypothetical protein
LPLYQHILPNGGRTLEGALGCVVSENYDATVIDEVTFFEVAAVLKVHQPAHGTVGEFNAAGGDGHHPRANFVAKVAAGFGTDGANNGHVRTDCFYIGVFKMNRFAGALTSGLHAGLAWPDHDDVVAHVSHRGHDSAAEPPAKREKQDNRDYSPRDAEHRECRAHPVAPQRRPTLLDQFF